MKLPKSKVLVAQACPTLCDPMDSAGKNTGVGCLSLLQSIFLTQDRSQVSCIAGMCCSESSPSESIISVATGRHQCEVLIRGETFGSSM